MARRTERLRGPGRRVIQLLWILFTLLVAAVITWFSAQPGEESIITSWNMAERVRPVLRLDDELIVIYYINLVIRKIAHFGVFFALGCGLYGSFDGQDRLPKLPSTIVAGVLFAVADEVHQSFVPGRFATLRDVIIDSCGVIAGSVVLLYLLKWLRKRKRAGETPGETDAA